MLLSLLLGAGMDAESRGRDPRPPTSADASRILAEIAPVTRRSQQLQRDVTMGVPLLGWGLAWLVGALVYQYVPGPAGAVLGLAACAAAATVTRVVRPREIRLSTEKRFALAWVVLFVISPLLVVIAEPASPRIVAVFLASLWATGMLLYGIGVRDVPLAVLGLVIVVMAAVIRLAAPPEAVLAVGLAGGLGMTGLGGWRMRWRRWRR
jgi:hypothetical protein